MLTAGVPGAGKSTLVNTLEDSANYRDIDPDVFKQICLTVAQREGILDDWLGRTMADGKPLYRGELSTLVHTYSTDLADGLERNCYRDGHSFIRQGTFSWEGLPSRYLNRLEDLGGYAGYQVMAVEIGRTQALAQADSRWWTDRTNGSDDTRYLPPSAINDLYSSPDATYSRALDTAVDLLNRPESGEFDIARLTLLDRVEPDQQVTKAYDHAPDHALTVDEIQRDVDTERSHLRPDHGTEPTTGNSLLDQVRDMRRQVDEVTTSRSITGDNDSGGTPPPATVERDPGGTETTL